MIHWKQTRLAAGLLIPLLATMACSTLKRPLPERHSYLLEAARTGEPSLAGRGLVLLVRPATVAASYSSPEFVYRQPDGTLVADFYHRFAAPPGTLLTEQLHLWLAGEGMDPHLVHSSQDGEVTHELQTRVLTLLGDYRSQPAHAILEVEFTLHERQGRGSVPVFRHVYRSRERLTEGQQSSLVAGWSSGLRSVLGRLDADLAALSF